MLKVLDRQIMFAGAAGAAGALVGTLVMRVAAVVEAAAGAQAPHSLQPQGTACSRATAALASSAGSKGTGAATVPKDEVTVQPAFRMKQTASSDVIEET